MDGLLRGYGCLCLQIVRVPDTCDNDNASDGSEAGNGTEDTADGDGSYNYGDSDNEDEDEDVDVDEPFGCGGEDVGDSNDIDDGLLLEEVEEETGDLECNNGDDNSVLKDRLYVELHFLDDNRLSLPLMVQVNGPNSRCRR